MSRSYEGLTPYEGYEDVLLERNNGVVVLTLNRPEKLNAFTPGIRVSLKRILDDVEFDDDAKVLVITGEGRAFGAGADLSTADRMSEEYQPSNRHERLQSRFGWVSQMRTMNTPIIAAINGVTAGGGMALAMACDIRVCADTARFVTGYNNIAVVPDVGATWLLTHLVGPSRALKWFWTNESVSSEEAYRTGLVDEVVPLDQLMERTMEIASRIAEGPSIALELTKRAVYKSLHLDLATHVDMELYLQGFTTDSEDRKEGGIAFREKRKPEYRGR